jgi:hypothetical protein
MRYLIVLFIVGLVSCSSSTPSNSYSTSYSDKFNDRTWCKNVDDTLCIRHLEGNVN